MRKIEVKDGKVLLNDRLLPAPRPRPGILPEGILPRRPMKTCRDIELAEMGFNGARKHQKVEDPRWLFWADTLGFLVWGEMANAYQYSPGYVRRMTAEWQEAVMRDYNHPCIVAWVPMNESWGPQPLIRPLADRAPPRPLPPDALTRPYQARCLQRRLGARHHRSLQYPRLPRRRSPGKSYATPESAVAAEPANRPIYVPGYTFRGEPILMTEFGGIAFSGDEGAGATVPSPTLTSSSNATSPS